MNRPTVCAALPNAFFDFAVSRGASRQMLSESSDLEVADLTDPDARVPLDKYISLLKAGIELCGEPALALMFGETVTMQSLSIVGLIGEAADTVEVGRGLINRFSSLMIDDDDPETTDKIEFILHQGKAWLRFPSRLYRHYPVLAESGFARCVCGSRTVFGSAGEPFIKEVHFTYEEPAHSGAYRSVFRVPVVFRSHTNGFVVDEKAFQTKLPRSNPYLSGVLHSHAETLMAKLEGSRSVRGRIEQRMIPLLHTGKVTMKLVAREMGYSRQTLSRKLKAEGVVFERVLAALRENLALHYLLERRMSVNETAYRLGFSEASAFSRAFKRWTGTSPRAMILSMADRRPTVRSTSQPPITES
jgi:AraC-like DNA-binding protein